jgi:CheY-like chemotaxis protein
MGKVSKSAKAIDILVVEDNPGDIRLLIEILRDLRLYNNISIARDGEEAMATLHHKKISKDPMPDLILLDLNLPNKDGREVLAEIKADPELSFIPVVIVTGSKEERDIVETFTLHADSYVNKPLDLDQFMAVIKSIGNFWLTVVKVPEH